MQQDNTEWEENLWKIADEVYGFPYEKVNNFIKQILSKREADLAFKIRQYKEHNNPIGDELNQGKQIACDEVLALLEPKE